VKLKAGADYVMETLNMNMVRFYPATPKKPKEPKYWPIETAPINVNILVWDSVGDHWTDMELKSLDEVAESKIMTHWRHQPKGPKNV